MQESIYTIHLQLYLSSINTYMVMLKGIYTKHLLVYLAVLLHAW